MHLFNQQVETQKFIQENNVQIQSWGSFAEHKNNIFEHEQLISIAGKYQRSVAQVILRRLLQRGIVVIPKSNHKEMIVENLNLFNFELSPEDIFAIVVSDTKKSLFFDHRESVNGKWPETTIFNI